ncbi:MAG: hypothetical protein HeimC3_07630 [Candidatus Heimdallarchaeota archaeon LC_3]|nr:MAG: hypothetical protein HeimC3_07630 [Candidatus Heimdallarchaeota archaeon LC_3]
MQYKLGTIAGAIYVVFAIFSVVILLPGGMLAHIDTENSVENISISLDNIVLNWRNSTHVESLTLELVVVNPSSNFKLILIDMRIRGAFLDGEEINVISTSSVYADLNEVIPSSTSETIYYSFPNILYFNDDNGYLYQEKMDDSSKWEWFIDVQIRASIGTESDLQIEGLLHHTGVSHTGNP